MDLKAMPSCPSWRMAHMAPSFSDFLLNPLKRGVDFLSVLWMLTHISFSAPFPLMNALILFSVDLWLRWDVDMRSVNTQGQSRSRSACLWDDAGAKGREAAGVVPVLVVQLLRPPADLLHQEASSSYPRPSRVSRLLCNTVPPFPPLHFPALLLHKHPYCLVYFRTIFCHICLPDCLTTSGRAVEVRGFFPTQTWGHLSGFLSLPFYLPPSCLCLHKDRSSCPFKIGNHIDILRLFILVSPLPQINFPQSIAVTKSGLYGL